MIDPKTFLMIFSIKRYFYLLILIILSCAISCSSDLDEDVLLQEYSHSDSRDNVNDFNDDDDDDEDNDDDDEDDEEDDDEDDHDDERSKHPSLYFVKLDPNVSEDDVEDLLDDLNSEEIWYREEINLRLWNTTVFPYADASGSQTTNIDGQIARARTRARVSGATPNLGGVVSNPLSSQGIDCFAETIVLSHPGEAEIMISIFDTGIDDGLIPEFSGYDYVEDDEEPNDRNGHGSQVAALVYSLVNQNGVSDNIKFDIRRTHDAQGLGYLSNVIPAILDAVQAGADVLNFSFNYQDLNEDTADRPMRLAIDYAEQNGVLILASAGNTSGDNDRDTIISFPASYPNANIISNAALNCGQLISDFSSYGSNTVDLALLGENIPVIGLDGRDALQSGTSFSTACITAMAAIMASHQENTDIADIKCALINTSQYTTELKDLVSSQGIVDFQAALANLNNCSP